MRGWAALLIGVSTGASAQAGCIVDDEMALFTAHVVAATRQCPQFRAASDAIAMDLMVSFEAVSDAEDDDPLCQRAVNVAVLKAESQFRVASKSERQTACETVVENMTKNSNFRDVLEIFKLTR